jgi:hypothetical protein
MKTTINKVNLNQILFIICVVVPFFNNYELSFAIWISSIFVTLKPNYSVEFIKYISIFLIILVLAILVGFFYDHRLYFVIRDITYLLKPISGLLLGYQLFNKKIKNPFQFIVYAGVSIAIYHLCLVAYGIVIEGARNVRDIREQAGYFNDFEIYSLVILVFKNQLKLILSKKRYTLFLVILSLSSFFYLARTNFIQFIILVLALKGFFILNKRALKVIFTIITFSIIAYTSIYYYNPMRNGKGIDEFLYKIKIAPTEAFSTKINRENWKQFNDNYRSYENIRTVQQLSHNNSLFFGEGIGSQVDLKQKTYLGDMELRFISFLHNGYMTILLKTGFLGLLIYLSSILFFFKRNLSRNNELKNVNYFFIGTGIFLIFSNWVFMGIYNLEDTKSLFIGFMFAYKNDLQIRFNTSKV